MNDNIDIDDTEALTQASIWFARLTADDTTCEQQAEFLTWLDAHEGNRNAYEDICSAWGAFDGLSKEQHAKLAQKPISHKSLSQKSDSAWKRFALVAATLIITAFVGFQYLSQGLNKPGTEMIAQFETYSTNHGESRSVELADGSIITLNTDTRLRTYYSETKRTVILDAGEAFFNVSPDAARPFTVDVGSGKVRVLGTRFNLYRTAVDTRLTVEHGRVEAISYSQIERLILTESQGASLKANGNLYSVKTIDMEQALAWQDGNFIFRNNTLSDVVTEINRYTDLNVSINGQSLYDLEISGVFSIKRIPDLLNTMELMLPISIEKHADGRRIITALQ